MSERCCLGYGFALIAALAAVVCICAGRLRLTRRIIVRSGMFKDRNIIYRLSGRRFDSYPDTSSPSQLNIQILQHYPLSLLSDASEKLTSRR